MPLENPHPFRPQVLQGDKRSGRLSERIVNAAFLQQLAQSVW